ncbi:hypothetical protein [Leeuwenhoekiella aequorea]|uniref:Uncharacterized protein n=1 Tax=Leeuwenhoekiella aequorea TaxID=283736 RepID=A0A4Q0PBT2_9FLAO|nr:hypothetical protein [Leeuwenhoekiella aequorea]RXG24273.1 hypothetical protein DSM00_58 [Leeuwenhoekiella aequorea]
MKKKLKSDLVSLAHKILKMDSNSDYETLKLEALKIYEALSIMAYVESHFDGAQPTIGKREIIEALEQEDTAVLEESIQEVQEIQQAPQFDFESMKEETDVDRIARIAASNTEVYERLRKAEADDTSKYAESSENQQEEKINQASLYEPVMEKIKDIVAQMPSEADAIDDMFQKITQEPKFVKNDRDEIGEYGRIPEFEEKEAVKEEAKPKKLNDRGTRGLTFGLNDRIAFIKHLFNGNSSDYNRVLSQLNTARSKEEAYNLINTMIKPDYNSWEGKEVYENRFMELVGRKFD